MVGVGRDLCESSSPTLLPKQAHLQQAAQDRLQVGLEYLQRRRLHNLPGQPVPVLRHPQREEVLPHVQTEPPMLQFVYMSFLYTCPFSYSACLPCFSCQQQLFDLTWRKTEWLPWSSRWIILISGNFPKQRELSPGANVSLHCLTSLSEPARLAGTRSRWKADCRWWDFQRVDKLLSRTCYSRFPAECQRAACAWASAGE